jgi:hypothetical protein
MAAHYFARFWPSTALEIHFLSTTLHFDNS